MSYYVCRVCGSPLASVEWMRFDGRRPRYDTPQVTRCPNCGLHRGPLSERRVRLDLWRNLLIWAAAMTVIVLLSAGSALWRGGPSWIEWTVLCAAAGVVVGLPVALLVSLAHRRKAQRIMEEWRAYRREGEAPKGAARASEAA